jgi:DNA replication protein DnaC
MAKSLKNEEVTNQHRNLAGDPNCPHCNGLGYLRKDVPVGHVDFGKIHTCSCRHKEIYEALESRLFSFSNLKALKHLSFNSFEPDGKEGLPKNQAATVRRGFTIAKEYAEKLEGWLLIEGGYGCGKTHLAAAIGNSVVETKGTNTLFITTPDLLDVLRFAYSDPEETFENRFDEIRSIPLLILDDFGTHNTTRWAQEKLFQLLNYRYINRLPLVITTNIPLDEIEGRIRSRLKDEELALHIIMSAPDYRRPIDETSTPGLSILHLFPDATFGTFSTRESDEGIGFEKIITESIEENGKLKTIRKRETIFVSKDDINTIKEAHKAAVDYAKNPEGWFVLFGDHGTGKTHLAAAIGNYQVGLGGQPPLMVDVIALLNYLRETFSPDTNIRFGKRFKEIQNTPLLILDGLGTENPTEWAKENLYQMLNFRYNSKLPTVITSAIQLEELDEIDPRLVSRLLDPKVCEFFFIEMPNYYDPVFTRRKKKAKHKK